MKPTVKTCGFVYFFGNCSGCPESLPDNITHTHAVYVRYDAEDLKMRMGWVFQCFPCHPDNTYNISIFIEVKKTLCIFR